MPDSIIFEVLAVDKASGTTRQAKISLQELQHQLDSLNRSAAGSGSTYQAWASGLGQVSSAARTATVAMAGLMGAAIRQAVAWDSAKRALAAATGSMAEAEKQMAAIFRMAKEPGITIDPLLRTVPVLEQLGLSFQQTQNMFLGFSRALATRGRGAEDFASAMWQVQESIQQNRFEMEDLRIVESRGLPVIQTLKEEFGLTVTELQGLTKAGLDTKLVWAALGEAMAKNEKFLKGSQAQADSAALAIDNFKDAIKKLGYEAAEQWLPAISKRLNELTDWLDKLKPEDIERFGRAFLKWTEAAAVIWGVTRALQGVLATAVALRGLGLIGGAGGAAAGAGALGGLGLLGGGLVGGAVAGGAAIGAGGFRAGAQGRGMPLYSLLGGLATGPAAWAAGRFIGGIQRGNEAERQAVALSAQMRASPGGGSAARPGGGGGGSLEAARRQIEALRAETEKMARAERAVVQAEIGVRLAENAKQELVARQKLVESLILQRTITQDTGEQDKLSLRIAQEKHDRTALVRRGIEEIARANEERLRKEKEAEDELYEQVLKKIEAEKELQARREEAASIYRDYAMQQAQGALGGGGNLTAQVQQYAQIVAQTTEANRQAYAKAIAEERWNDAARIAVDTATMQAEAVQDVADVYSALYDREQEAADRRREEQEQERERHRRITEEVERQVRAEEDRLRTAREINQTLADRYADFYRNLAKMKRGPQEEFAAKYLDFLRDVGGPGALAEGRRAYQQVQAGVGARRGYAQQASGAQQIANRQRIGRIQQLFGIGGGAAGVEAMGLAGELLASGENIQSGLTRQDTDWLQQIMGWAQSQAGMQPGGVAFSGGGFTSELTADQVAQIIGQARQTVALQMPAAVQFNVDPQALAAYFGQQAQAVFGQFLNQALTAMRMGVPG